MIKYKTKYVNKIGDEKYPIYLIVNDNGRYDLECRYEIYAIAWYDIFTKSIADYEKELK